MSLMKLLSARLMKNLCCGRCRIIRRVQNLKARKCTSKLAITSYGLLHNTLSGYSFYCAGFVFGECIGVTDGDTIEVLRDHTAIKVRLEGIDCPERGQDFGQKAKQFTSGLVFGKAVEIRPIGEDRYGRTVARVYC